MTRADLENEMCMLQGNINRMCVTDDVEELDNMREWAIKRIELIYSINLERVNQ